MNRTKIPEQITTEADVEQFYRHCTEVIGVGFHCNTSFAEYLQFSFDAGMSVRIFDEVVVERYEDLNLQCFGFCAANNLDVKAVCLIAVSKVIEEIQGDLTLLEVSSI